MTVGKIIGLVGVALLAMVLNIIASIVYMVIYGHVIDPGHEPQYYQEHIQVAAPYCSLVVGLPLMFAIGWWVAGFWQKRPGIQTALIVWLIYVILDLTILLFAGLTLRIGLLFLASFATKLLGAYAGGWVRTRRKA